LRLSSYIRNDSVDEVVFVTSEQQVHHLVAELLRREALTVLVAGVEEHREHVVALTGGGRRAPVLDLAQDDRVEARRGRCIFAHGEPGPRRSMRTFSVS
jgi:hypothetical protein